MGMRKEYFFLEVCKVLVIHIKTTFESPIGHAPLSLDQCEHLLQSLIKVHNGSFTLRESILYRTIFYTLFRLEKQWVGWPILHTLFRTPFMGDLVDGFDRSHGLSTFHIIPDGQ